MITNFKLFENNYHQELIRKIQSVLSPDLLKGMWNQKFDNPLEGHCYIATEALYWLLGGPDSEFRPYVLSHKNFPESLDERETHWFLKNKNTGEILDPTSGQFEDIPILYDRGTPNGMMNYPKGGSKRAKEIIKRIKL